MKLGIGLPNSIPARFGRRLLLDWARMADEAGFHVLATVDRPNYDAWDPLVTLAGAAAVTERIRLATTILQLPNRNEVLVAKQAAVIDRLSDGRLDLGVGIGAREDDYAVFSASFAGRGRRLEAQIGRMREIWSEAALATDQTGVLGPAPVQADGPPIWVGAMKDAAVARATRLGDGYVFGASSRDAVSERAREIRALAAAAGRERYVMVALLFAALGDDAQVAHEEGARHLGRYYARPAEAVAPLIEAGSASAIADTLATWARCGIDVAIVLPQIPRLDQVEQLAALLPEFSQ